MYTMQSNHISTTHQALFDYSLENQESGLREYVKYNYELLINFDFF